MNQIKVDKLIRSKRKTIGLEVTRDTRLIVRAPRKVPLEYIKKFIFEKRFWIKRKQKIAQEKFQNVVSRKFVNGEGFLYLGDTYRLNIINQANTPLSLDQEFKILNSHLSNARQVFIDWYKRRAYQKISERVNWYSVSSGFKYNKIGITNAQKRWGSCSSAKGNLYFSWRLIMAPLRVIDYVVAHEIAHLQEKNHANKFWNKVRILFPNYQESQRWLKSNGHLLVV